MKLKTYSVLLRFPEYAATDWPNDMYTIAVEAHSYDAAADIARGKSFKRINRSEKDLINGPDDMEVVCVVEGQHKFYIPL
jgi:hypothetical protein